MERQYTRGMPARLVFYPPEGAVDGGTADVTVLSASGGVISATETISQADAAAVVATGAASGATSLDVDDASDFVRGMRLLLVLPSGKRCEVVVEGVVEDDPGPSGTVDLQWGLPWPVPAGATLRAWDLAKVLSATETAGTLRNARARFDYEVGGELVRWEETFDVVPRPFRIPLTEADLRAEAPDWGDFGGASSRWRQALDAAHEEVDKLLRRNGIYADRILDRATLKGAVVNNFLARLHALTASPRAADYTKAMHADIAALSGGANGYDADDSGDVTDGERGLVPGGGLSMRQL
jgi:hypothetical protein